MQKLLEDAKEGVEVPDANGTVRQSVPCMSRYEEKGRCFRYVLRWDETFRKTWEEQGQLGEEEHIRTKPTKIQTPICESQPVIKDKHKLWLV